MQEFRDMPSGKGISAEAYISLPYALETRANTLISVTIVMRFSAYRNCTESGSDPLFF